MRKRARDESSVLCTHNLNISRPPTYSTLDAKQQLDAAVIARIKERLCSGKTCIDEHTALASLLLPELAPKAAALLSMCSSSSDALQCLAGLAAIAPEALQCAQSTQLGHWINRLIDVAANELQLQHSYLYVQLPVAMMLRLVRRAEKLLCSQLQNSDSSRKRSRAASPAAVKRCSLCQVLGAFVLAKQEQGCSLSSTELLEVMAVMAEVKTQDKPLPHAMAYQICRLAGASEMAPSWH
jgi:hypothetical protein